MARCPETHVPPRAPEAPQNQRAGASGSCAGSGGPVVRVIGLRKTYPGVRPLEVLHGLDFTVEAGEFVAIVGQSGSGKSTLLNLIGALDRPTAGQVIIEGRDLSTMGDNDLAALRNCCIGFVFQFHHLLEDFTCLENALMPISIGRGEPEPEDVLRVTKMLRRVGLGERLGQLPRRLSGGERQRTAIVRALSNSPRLVLADEPTGNLDSRTSREVFSLMREMNRETKAAFLLITHDDRLAAQADRILRIADGYLTEEQPTGETS